MNYIIEYSYPQHVRSKASNGLLCAIPTPKLTATLRGGSMASTGGATS